MTRFVLLVVLAFFASGCTGVILYERGLPKRVQVDRETGDPALQLAIRQPSGRVDIIVTERRHVRLERRIVYGTVEVRNEYSNPAWELIEVPFGAVVLAVVLPTIWTGLLDPPESEMVKFDIWSVRLAQLFGFINPAVSMLSPDVVRDPTCDKELFFSKPRVTEYDVATPKKGVAVSYLVMDAHGDVIQRATAKSDAFGRVSFEAPPGSDRVEARVGEVIAKAKVRFASAITNSALDRR